jgi:hypothetical protein
LSKGLPPPDGAREGEFLGAGVVGFGDVDSPHAHEDKTREFYGNLPQPEALTREWVLARLMREATDYGTRTRQTGRVAALKLLGDAMGMFAQAQEADSSSKDTVREEFAAMPREERMRRVKLLLAKLQLDEECEAIIGSKLR